MNDATLLTRFDGPIVMIGFGSIGKGTLPLIERHIAFDRSKFVVIAPDDSDRHLLDERKLRFMHLAITKANYRDVLTPLLKAGPGRGLVVNLSVDTSSVDLMELSRELDAFYIDTVVEPWPASTPIVLCHRRRGPTMRCAKACLRRGAVHPAASRR